MRKILILIIIVVATLPVAGQANADYGASGGIITYLGENNPLNIINNPGPAAQLFYRYNFNPRQALKANLLGGYVSPLGSFVGELGATYEFNFFPYSTFRSRFIDYTPYIAGGAALSYMKTAGPFMSIPFSAGFKVNVADHVGIEIEYGFRKTFTDELDGIYEITNTEGNPVDHSWIHNNDWYTFFGFSVTWKMYNRLLGCPAFAEMEKNKKRRK